MSTIASTSRPATSALPASVVAFLDSGRSELLIDGQWRAPASEQYLPTIDPATEEPIFEIARGGKADVDAAVQAAHAAMRGAWGAMDPAARGLLIGRLADALEERADEFAVLEVLDTGKPLASARADVELSVRTLRFFAGAPARLYGTVAATTPDKHSFIRREPVGVAGLITAWNFPLVLAAWKVGPALAAGVAFVIKPSELTSLSTLRLGSLAGEVGFPPGVFNIVTGTGPEVGTALVDDPRIAKISFTGSTAVGQSIQARAAATSKRVTLELGGKSPHIVFADADLPRAVAASALGGFVNAGQVCASGNRVFVQRTIAREFLEGLRAEAGALVVGNGLDESTTLGPMVSRTHFEKVRSYLQIGAESGYDVVAGGGDAGGLFIQPTVFSNVGNRDRLAREEVFGPVITVTLFDTEEEVIEMANDSDYGLAAGVWTSSLSRAHRVSAALQAGTVWVNTYLDLDPALPFGGYKNSGYGRDMGDAAVEGFTELKTVIMQL